MIAALLVSLVFASAIALGLALALRFFSIEADPLVEQIEMVLPQTQCGQCNFPGCRPYAEAMSRGEADINQCPPGGDAVIEKLSALLGVEAKALNPDNGEHQAPEVALIIESQCIGCTKCIKACPVDAIIGASKQMHSVIEIECTGCALCLPPCPVDCIELVPQASRRALWLSV